MVSEMIERRNPCAFLFWQKSSQDHDNNALRSFVRDALRYLVAREDADATEIFSFIESAFSSQLVGYYSSEVLKAAAHEGKFIIADKLSIN